MLLAKRAEWYGRIIRISWLSRMPSTYAPCPKGGMKICYSSWSQKCIRLPLWMGVIEMLDTKAMTIPCPYYKNTFGGQGWPTRWDNLLGPAHAASSMREAPLHPIVATAPLDLLYVDFTSIETTLEPNQSPWVANVLVFKTISQSMCWHIWPPINCKNCC